MVGRRASVWKVEEGMSGKCRGFVQKGVCEEGQKVDCGSSEESLCEEVEVGGKSDCGLAGNVVREGGRVGEK